MIARGFKSVLWVATVGAAALGCYMVSLRVATERNELARVERQIVAAKREIRSLETELGTRGRLSQLEQWNAEVLALSAPGSNQFLKSEVSLARLERRDPGVAERSGELRLASLETAPASPAEAKPAERPARIVQAVAPAAQPTPVMQRASLAQAEPAPAAPAKARKAEKKEKAASTAPAASGQRLGSKLAAELGDAAKAEGKASGGN